MKSQQTIHSEVTTRNSDTEAEKRNIQTILFNIGSFNAGDLDGTVVGIGKNFHWYSNLFTHAIVGPEETKAAMESVADRLVGAKFFVNELVANGDYVAVLLVVTAKFSSGFLGQPSKKDPVYVDVVFNKFDAQGERIQAKDFWLEMPEWLAENAVFATAQFAMLSESDWISRNTLAAMPTVNFEQEIPADSNLKIPLALASAFPQGVDPYTYRIDVVEKYLGRVGDFTIVSAPASSTPVVVDGRVVGADVTIRLHRFQVDMKSPTIQGIRSCSTTGGLIGEAHVSWRSIVKEYVAEPGREPSVIPFDPNSSQRCVIKGHFRFNDRFRSAFQCFGTGTTGPALPLPGEPQPTKSGHSWDAAMSVVFTLAAILDVTEGSGRFQDSQGVLVTHAQGKEEGAFSSMFILLRVISLEHQYQSKHKLPTLRRTIDLEPNISTLTFMGAMDKENPVTFNISPQGRFLGADGHERLRVISTQLSVRGKEGIRCAVRRGVVTAEGNFMIHFDPFHGEPPFSFQTTDGSWRFCDQSGKTIGQLKANIVQGRAFPVKLPGVPAPVFRVGGLAPIIAGTGVFSGATGLISVNVFLSIFPRFLNSILLIQIWDPEDRFRSC